MVFFFFGPRFPSVVGDQFLVGDELLSGFVRASLQFFGFLEGVATVCASGSPARAGEEFIHDAVGSWRCGSVRLGERFWCGLGVGQEPRCSSYAESWEGDLEIGIGGRRN